MRRYHGNYPYEQRALVRSAIVLLCVGPAVFIELATAFGFAVSLRRFARGEGGLHLLLSLACILIALLYAREWLADLLHFRESKLQVTYSERVGDTHTFLAGKAISRNLRLLDDLADRLEVKALYDFGLEPYFKKDGIRWIAPEDARRTVAALLRHLRESPGSLTDSAAVIDDLEKFDQGFELAEQKGARICFQFTNARAYSGAAQRWFLPLSHF